MQAALCERTFSALVWMRVVPAQSDRCQVAASWLSSCGLVVTGVVGSMRLARSFGQHLGTRYYFRYESGDSSPR
jgi:hypothetical protein